MNALRQRIKSSNIYIKMFNWEYWPLWLVYLPVIPVFLYYVLRTRRFFFFSNVNPEFKTGAFLGASKYQILNQISKQYIPTTIYVESNQRDIDVILYEIEASNITFPCIAKPDVGERGLLVELINDAEELSQYLRANRIDIIIQEYIDLPNECGIFYVRYPDEMYGRIVSVGLKDFLTIIGDGRSTVAELLQKADRAKLQLERLRKKDPDLMVRILANKESLKLEPIGNHSRGTSFLDGNHLISDALVKRFDMINKEMQQVHFGRFDIKFNTWEELLNGENLKILEMNGAASEPIHVYDNRVSIRNKYSSFYQIWHILYDISRTQDKKGYKPINSYTAYKFIREYKRYIKSLNLDWKMFSISA